MISRRRFLGNLIGAAALPPLLSRGAAARRRIIVYVGGFTPGGKFAEPYSTDAGHAAGIEAFGFDDGTGRLGAGGVAWATNSSPNWLLGNRAGDRLYATNRVGGPDGNGGASALVVDRPSGRLTLLGTVSSGGAGPTHLSVHPAGRHILVANYVGGSVAVLPIRSDGSLGDATDVRKLRGRLGPAHATDAPVGSFAISGHDASHAHMVEADPTGRFVLATDLGADRILVWGFDAARGRLLPNDPASVSIPPGDGPRHFAFHRSGRWLYVVHEESSSISRFAFDPEQGRLTWQQTLSTLPPGFAGTSFAAAIALSPDGRLLYVTNRLHDSIAAFAIEADGGLRYLGETWSRGDYPRALVFAPEGDWLLCCNQRSDGLASFRVDRKTGCLEFSEQYVPAPSCTTMALVRLS